MSDRKKTLNWEQVRGRIDSGATGEKVSGTDPAAAPLGTDDEAAGFPSEPTEDDIKQKPAARQTPAALSRAGGKRQRRGQYRGDV